MSNCYICSNTLNRSNTSKEHILSNACGGRLKSYKLLCKTCNEKMGADFDSELAKQIDPLAILHNIRRDRKRPVTASGKIDHRPIDSNAVNKSIAKSAISFFLVKGGDKKFIHHLIPFLLNTEKIDTVTPHFPDGSTEPGQVRHLIKLAGRPSEKILYCYIGLFSTCGFMVRLNDEYDGPPIDKTYIYDVLQSIELKKEFLLDYTRSRLFSYFQEKK